MIPRYPAGGETRLPGPSAPPAPVRAAIRLMYVGAAASAGGVLADLTTRAELARQMKDALAKAPVSVPGDAASLGTDTAVGMAVIVGLICTWLWIVVARACGRGRQSGRTTASVLFGLGTLLLAAGPPDLGLRTATIPARVMLCIVWLLGLAVIVLAWRRDSSAFLTDR